MNPAPFADLMPRTLFVLLAASLLGAGAASAQGSRPAPPKAPADPDPPLPVAAFIDSAALHQALLAAPLAPREFKLKPIFMVRYDRAGALQGVDPISDRLIPAEFGRAMAALLRAHVRPSLDPARESEQRVWIQSGPTPKIAVIADIVEARPQLSNRGSVGTALAGSVQRLLRERPYLAERRVSSIVSMRVSEDGKPENPVLRQTTGEPEIDREILIIARTMRFVPATLDGYPVKVTVTVPVNLQFPAPAANMRP